MAKWTEDAILDLPLDQLALATQITLCEGQPATYEEANSTKGTGAGKVLARATLTGVDFTKSNDPTSGRRITVAEKLANSVEATGNGDHVALTIVADTRLMHANTASAQSVTVGGTVDITAWDITFEDPT